MIAMSFPELKCPVAPHHVVLIAIGSSGDVHPLVGLGLALQRRGHRVTVATNDHFAPLLARVGLGFASLGSVEEFNTALNNPDVWHPARGLKAIVDSGVGELAGRVCDLLATQLVQDAEQGLRPTVAAGTLLAVGARIAQERLGLRYASVGFAPSVVRSRIAMPRLPLLPLPPRTPMWVKTALWWLGDTLVVDPLLAPPINAVRARVGLPPVRGIARHWWYSQQLNICMWPPMFGAVQADWPANSVLTGFPMYDEAGSTGSLGNAGNEASEPLPAELTAFLAQPGGAPLVFTPGSAMRFGHDFFAAAASACQRLQRRGILLTRYPEQLPDALPPDVLHVAYAPFSQLLPHAAVLVHHGGIGTTSQALAAGVAQLVMPMAHDQFDNAQRVRQLGVGDWLPRRRFTAARVAARLQHLLTDNGVAQATRAVASQLKQAPDGCAAAADAMESLMCVQPPASKSKSKSKSSL